MHDLRDSDRPDDRAARAVENLIRAHYDDVNGRRLDRAAARFHPDARIEDVTGQVQCGPAGFSLLAHRWLTAFPNGTLTVQEIAPQGRNMYDVDLIAEGTHAGTLALGPWTFRPSHVAVQLRARELFHVEDGQIRLASLTFDLQDLVSQLTTVDTARLLAHLARIQQLGEQLAAESDATRQRELIDRIGMQLDAARHEVRPHFRAKPAAPSR
jgi:SnoaL-like polyketide cyclase